MIKLSNALLLSLLVQFAAYAQDGQSVLVQDDARVGLIVTGEGNTLNTTQIFGKSPEYAELKSALQEYEEQIGDKADLCEEMEEDGLPERYIENCTSELARLNRKRDSIQKIERKFKDDVIRLATTFDQVSINSDRLKIAKSLFDKGRITEADAVLNARNMRGETAYLLSKRSRLRHSQAETDSLLTLKANEWLIKAHITKTRYELTNWEDSVHYYFHQSMACQLQYSNLSGYSDFLYHQNELDSSYHYSLVLTRTFEPELSRLQKIKQYIRLANIHHLRNQLEQGEIAYLQVLALIEELKMTEPQMYRYRKGILCSNLGLLYESQGLLKKAEDYQLQALTAFLDLSKSDSLRWRADLASTQNNLGVIYQSQEKYQLALDQYMAALAIRKTLAAEAPDRYQAEVAKSLNNVASILRSLGSLQSSLEMHLEAQKSWESLARLNPDRFRPALARTYHNKGSVLLNLRQEEQARLAYHKAIHIRQQLVRKDTLQYLQPLVKSQTNLAVSFLGSRQFDKAIPILQSAIVNFERLRNFGIVDLRNHELALQGLGVSYAGLGEKTKALEAYEQQLTFARNLPTSLSTREINIGMALFLVAGARGSVEDSTGAVLALKEAVAYADKFFYHPRGQALFFNITHYVGLGKIDENLAEATRKTEALQLQILNEEDVNVRLVLQQQLIEVWEEALLQFPQSLYLSRFLALNYYALSKDMILTKAYVVAEKAARRGVELDETQAGLFSNWIMAVLLQDRAEVARKVYQDFKTISDMADPYSQQIFLQGLRTIVRSGITDMSLAEILKLLRG